MSKKAHAAVTDEECKEVAAKLINDPIYFNQLQLRLRSGQCSPSLERFFWQHLIGTPVERQEVTFDYGSLTDEELEASAQLAALLAKVDKKSG